MFVYVGYMYVVYMHFYVNKLLKKDQTMLLRERET